MLHCGLVIKAALWPAAKGFQMFGFQIFGFGFPNIAKIPNTEYEVSHTKYEKLKRGILSFLANKLMVKGNFGKIQFLLSKNKKALFFFYLYKKIKNLVFWVEYSVSRIRILFG